MPATIKEIQGIVTGLSTVVKGLVGAIQAIHTAQTTVSQAQALLPENQAVSSTGTATLRLLMLQFPMFREDTKVRDDVESLGFMTNGCVR